VSLTAAAGGQVTFSGVIQDPTGQDTTEATAAAALTSVNKIGDGTVILTNTNTYAGKTSVTAGTLRLGANNALPDATAVSIASATLDAATFTDTIGTLDVTTLTSKINLGSAATLAFANSSAVPWTGGKLNITGTFVPGVSLRFGTDNTGLTSIQLGLISAPGFATFSLTNQGYLTATGGIHPYDTWSGSAPFDADANADGVENGLAWMLGAPNKDTSALNKLPVPAQAAGALTLTFDCLNGNDRGSAVLIVQSTSDPGQQPAVWAETTVPAAPGTFTTGIVDFEITDPGAPGGLLHVEATIPFSEAAAGKLFGRLKSIR
jgi:autotransporter-associated beta strand protein